MPRLLTDKEISQRWKVATSTAFRWVAKWGRDDCSDDQKLASHLLGQSKIDGHIRDLAETVLKDSVRIAVGIVEAETKPEEHKEREGVGDLDGLLKDTERSRRYALTKLEESQRNNNTSGVTLWTKQVKELTMIELSVRTAQAKLGHESGQIITQKEFERMVTAIMSRLSLGIQRAGEELAKRIVKVEDETKATKIIHDIGIREVIVAPMRRAIDQASQCGLPVWVGNVLSKTVGDHIEEGEKELAAYNE